MEALSQLAAPGGDRAPGMAGDVPSAARLSGSSRLISVASDSSTPDWNLRLPLKDDRLKSRLLPSDLFDADDGTCCLMLPALSVSRVNWRTRAVSVLGLAINSFSIVANLAKSESGTIEGATKTGRLPR